MHTLRTLASGLALAALALGRPLFAQAADLLAGSWKGKIVIPGAELGVELEIEQDESGAWRGEIDIPQQAAQDLALTDFVVEGAKARFKIRGVPGDPTFDGELDASGARLSGPFRQGGQDFTFELERTDRAAELAAANDALSGLDAFVAAELERWKTPGASVAVCWRGELLLARGFGLRDVEGGLAVTADTLFAIGSTTKAFTCALLADLAEEGLFEWDEPARRYLPELELHDAYATWHITPLDLVTHRSGLPRHDLVWYGSDATRAELIARLRYLEPSTELRTEFQYQNLMYMTAGELAGRLAGTSWEEALRARLLAPLGMERSTLSVEAMQADADHALPYAEKEKVVERVPFRVIDAVGPAGSIDSSANEMARWVAFLLAEGETAGGARILEVSSVGELFEPVIVASLGSESFEEEGPSTYARGWVVQTYRGRERVHHGGGIDGFTALVTLFPRDELGIVVLTNRGGSALPHSVTPWIADRVLGLEAIDWSARLKTLADAAEIVSEAGKAAGELGRKKGTSPSHPLADYAGEFRDPGYGIATVTLADGALTLTLNGIEVPLEHWHYDVFRASSGPAEDTRVQFHMDLEGDITAFTSALEPRLAPIRFERAASAALSDPARLARFVGTYELGGVHCTLSLRGDTLMLSVPGQPNYALVPRTETDFGLKGMEGYSLSATLEGERCTRITFLQPNGTFVATRVEDAR